MKNKGFTLKRSTNKGFTLIEIMIVVALVSVGLGAGLLGFQKTSNQQRMNGAADRVRQLFAQAKANAQSGKKDCALCNRTGAVDKSCGNGDDPLQGWMVGITPAPISAPLTPATTPAVVVVQGVCGPVGYPAADANRQTFSQTSVSLPLNIQVQVINPLPTPLVFQPAGGGVLPSNTSITVRTYDMTDTTLQRCFTVDGAGSIAWKTTSCP